MCDKLYKKHKFYRLISTLLAAFMIMALFNIPGKTKLAQVEAAEDSIELNGEAMYVWSGNTITCTAGKADAPEFIVSSSVSTLSVSDSATLQINENATGLNNVSSFDVESTGYSGNPALIIKGGDVSIPSLYVGESSIISNAGNLTVSNFALDGEMINDGYLKAPSIELSSAHFDESRVGKIEVTSGGDLVLEGLVPSDAIRVPYNATITNYDDSVTYKIDLIRANGSVASGLDFYELVEGKTASEISSLVEHLQENVTLEIICDDTVYLNSKYEVKVKATGEDGRTLTEEEIGGVKILYKPSYGDDFIEGQPPTTSTTNYTLRAESPGNEYYYNSYETKELSVKYLPLEKVSTVSDGKYLEVSGLENERYSSGEIYLTPASGFQARDYVGGSEYGSQVVATEDVLFSGGYYNIDYSIAFKRESDEAESDIHTLSELGLDLSDVIFDMEDPVITGTPMLDGEAVSISTGDSFIGRSLSFSISDDNLDKVTVNGESQTVASGRSDVVIEAEPGGSGKYSVVAMDKAGRALELVFTFNYKKSVPTAEVSVADLTAGTEIEPVLTTDSDGKSKAVYKYKKQSEPDTAYSEKQPTGAGEYSVMAIVPETDLYEGTSCEDTFTIIRKKPSVAEVVVPDIEEGTDYNPVLTTDSDGKSKAVYEYKEAAADDSTFTKTKPSKKGEYKVRATIPMTDMFEEAVCYTTFKISEKSEKSTAKAKVTVPDTVVGVDYEPVISTNSDGKDKTVFEYKKYDEDDSAYTKKKPVKAGKYKVRATVPATKNYKKIVCESTFTISKKEAQTAKVTIEDVYVGQEYKPVVETDSDGKKKVVFEYRLKDEEDSAYTTEKPEKAGKYVVRATVPETDTYKEVVVTEEFSIRKYDTTATVSLGVVYSGTAYVPVVTTRSDGKELTSFKYKAFGASDTEYVETRPVLPGRYEVMAIVPETDKYKAFVCETDFEVIYLEAPKMPYSFSGSEGKNGYYVSDVSIVPAEGFTIASSFMGTYFNTFNYSEQLDGIYLRRVSDGALTDKILISEKLKIDKLAPTIMDAKDSIGDMSQFVNGNVVYSDNYAIRINDEHLKRVHVNANGGKDDISGGKEVVNGKDSNFVLDPKNGIINIQIEAEDEAGNISRASFTLKALWLKDKLIPADKLLPLDPAEEYHLGDGNWKVEGDPTVYKGGKNVFIKSEGSYTFSRD